MSDHSKHARADHEIHELIRSRWSPRAFDATREVPRADLLRLFEAARWAPSSRNEQPWRFLVLSQSAWPDQWRALFETLTAANQAWAASAPVLALLAVRPEYESTGGINQMSWYDAGHAVALLTIQATAQGLSVRQMEGFDRTRARAACAIPPEFEPGVVMAIGYAGDPEVLPLERHREAEKQPRRRKTLDQFVYEGRWGNAPGVTPGADS